MKCWDRINVRLSMFDIVYKWIMYIIELASYSFAIYIAHSSQKLILVHVHLMAFSFF